MYIFLLVVPLALINGEVIPQNCTENCDAAPDCRLPSCLCPSLSPPGNLGKTETPQFVIFAFNDVITKEFFAPLMKVFTTNRRNPTGKAVKATIFVSHGSGQQGSKVTTDYCLVRKLYESGHEIASHSGSHRKPAEFWQTKASVKQWEDEMIGYLWTNLTDKQKAGLDEKHVQGAKAPFFAAGGDHMTSALVKKFKYDSSLVAVDYVSDGGLWPFTLDFQRGQNIKVECEVGVCAQLCYKGFWEVPQSKVKCGENREHIFIDECIGGKTNFEILDLLMETYKKRKDGNRSPLILNFLTSCFQRNVDLEDGLKKFIDKILEDEETYIVTIEQLLKWVRTPVAVPVTKALMTEMSNLFYEEKNPEVGVCETKTGTGLSSSFPISGNALVILEFGVLGFILLILIARDSD